MPERFWTCPRTTAKVRCAHKNAARKKRCELCGKLRPPKRHAKHVAVLKSMNYDELVAVQGERCWICKEPRKPGAKRLAREHDHSGDGMPRGLACMPCNRRLVPGITSWWLRAAADYLDAAEHRAFIAAQDAAEFNHVE